MWKYGIILCFLFSCFLVLCVGCLNEKDKLTQTLSFYAVGDNLIHPILSQCMTI